MGAANCSSSNQCGAGVAQGEAERVQVHGDSAQDPPELQLANAAAEKGGGTTQRGSITWTTSPAESAPTSPMGTKGSGAQGMAAAAAERTSRLSVSRLSVPAHPYAVDFTETADGRSSCYSSEAMSEAGEAAPSRRLNSKQNVGSFLRSISRSSGNAAGQFRRMSVQSLRVAAGQLGRGFERASTVLSRKNKQELKDRVAERRLSCGESTVAGLVTKLRHQSRREQLADASGVAVEELDEEEDSAKLLSNAASVPTLQPTRHSALQLRRARSHSERATTDGPDSPFGGKPSEEGDFMARAQTDGGPKLPRM